MSNVYGNAVDAYNNAVAGAASATSASGYSTASAASASSAAAAGTAALWVSGNTYTLGLCVWSPANKYVYRKITSNVSTNLTVDPSSNATDWALAAPPAPMLVIQSATTGTASAGGHYAQTNVAASYTQTPTSPAVGDVFWVTPCNGLYTNYVKYNATDKIQSLAEDMYLSNPNVSYGLRYINSTVGWRLF